MKGSGESMRVVDVKVFRIVEETGQVLVEVTLEDTDGTTESFVMDLWEMLDTDKFAEILHNWKTYIMPMRKKVYKKIKVEKKLDTIYALLNSLVGITVDTTDTPNDVKRKILGKASSYIDKFE